METCSPVLIIFFNRPSTLRKVFERVREVKPPILFLAQDGPRDINDMVGVERCREIVEKIDWPCKVYRNYEEKNLGCDPNVYKALDWAFSYVDCLIILEDDDIASYSFFKFCDQMLERYKYDERIQTISGFQRLERYGECPYSYYFSMINAGIGWATWKRVWEDVKKHSSFPVLKDQYCLGNLKILEKKIFPKFYSETSKNLKITQIKDTVGHTHSSWERLLGQTMMSESRLSISPCYNLVTNIGLTDDATHSTSDLRMFHPKIRELFFMKAYEIDFPLRHPPVVMRDMIYEKRFEREFPSSKLDRLMLKIDYAFRVLIYKGPGALLSKIKRIRNK